MTAPDTGVAVGTLEEGRDWVGRRGEVRTAPAPVCELGIRNFCSLVEDGNAAYWIDGVSPPGLLLGYSFDLPWRPGGSEDRALLGQDIPLPGRYLINVACDTRFERELRVGDTVSMVEEVLAVSDEKRTRLGCGSFVTTRMTFSNQRDEVVATNDNVMVRYTPEMAPPSDRPPVDDRRDAAAAGDGERLAPIRIHVDHRRVCHNAAATWDWFPGHHDPAYARDQGQPTIYVSTVFFQGLLDRLVTEWAGPGAVVMRRKLQIRASLFAGEDAVADGRVVARTVDGGDEIVEIEGRVSGANGCCVTSEITVRRPGGAGTEPRRSTTP
ncbi:MaoC family dehydratase N-terminal domain-containing protein [Conexibacter sp. W3-3-2]|uniref:FAS1-like dehydratase domain-containing protein n=1 Tax=Conexibacter sp. W3-3-2 TaxID=2675227 RepID=UPI0018A8DAEE|nr:MaoC family dehydratase N-terminal domain-containing protein [Conexibacter sp. W3-3-2]